MELLLWWSLATILGLVEGMVVFIAVGSVVGEAIDSLPEFVFGLVIGSIFGIAFGIAQWWVLRGQLPQAASWIWATFIGFIVGAFVIFGLMEGGNPDEPIVTKLGHAIVLGAALGIAQWLVLRGKVDRAAIWILISIVAWLIAEIMGVFFGSLVVPPLDLLGLFLVGGVLPGIGMVWLLNRSKGAVQGTV